MSKGSKSPFGKKVSTPGTSQKIEIEVILPIHGNPWERDRSAPIPVSELSLAESGSPAKF
jgi:hypothetical protein